MRTLILVSMACLAIPWVGGCGPSYRTTPVRLQVKPTDRIAVQQFTADSLATAQMIRETLIVELKESDLTIVDVNDSPDLIIGGTITEGREVFSGRYVDSVFIIVSASNGKFVTSLRFSYGSAAVSWSGSKTPGEIGTELGKRLARKFKKK